MVQLGEVEGDLVDRRGECGYEWYSWGNRREIWVDRRGEWYSWGNRREIWVDRRSERGCEWYCYFYN